MMRWLIPMLCAGAMLLRPEVSLQAAADACALFARSVLPGLYPYMILLLVALDRLPAQAPYPLLVALGWGAGSPCGAKICAARQGRTVGLGAVLDEREPVVGVHDAPDPDDR